MGCRCAGKGAVHVHHGQHHAGLAAYPGIPGGGQFLLGGEHFEVADKAPFITGAGQLGGLFRILRRQVQMRGPLAGALVTDQASLGVFQGRQHRLLIIRQRALADYQQAVLSALEDTETRLVRYQRARQRAAHLDLAAENAEEAAQLARTRYERGFIGYFEVLAAEQELTATRDARVRSQTGVVLAMVDVYRALAGAPAPQEGRRVD